MAVKKKQTMTDNSNKVLLHACCATCSGYPIEKLREMGYSPVVYFFNPNIFPPDEFNKRLQELVRYTERKEIPLIVEKQDAAGWYNAVSGLENEPERGKRCRRCFEYRLLYTALKAMRLGYDFFTTTLTVSPHKQSKVIFEVAEEIAKKYELVFLDIDFKKQDGFLKTMQIAKEEGFYRQNYCGCEFSMFEK